MAAYSHYHPTLPLSESLMELSKMLAIFGIGSFVMRGAGCIINDLWDRDIDAKVTRTCDRPLANGRLTPFQAISILGVHLAGGLFVLTRLNFSRYKCFKLIFLQFLPRFHIISINFPFSLIYYFSIQLGVFSLIPVTIYPLMKRIIWWPQLVLGIAFSWGALLGWTAITNSYNPSIQLSLYSAGIFWTLIYDTIYAYQDKSDDLKIGVKSTAILFGEKWKWWLGVFAFGTMGSLIIAGILNHQGIGYWLGLIGGSIHLGWQITTLKIENAKDCLDKFKSNKIFGGIIFGGILLDFVIKNA